MPRFQAGPNRDRLGFADAVRASFGFLQRERDFRVVRAESTLVRFESSRVFVTVFHGRGSFELGVEIGKSEGDPPPGFSLLEILAFDDGYDTDQFRPPQASTPDAVARGVKVLAELTKAHAKPAIDGDDEFFNRLAAQRRLQSRELTESYTAISLRGQAGDAWSARDYAGVVAAYRALTDLTTVQLTRAEWARLRYARKQLDG